MAMRNDALLLEEQRTCLEARKQRFEEQLKYEISENKGDSKDIIVILNGVIQNMNEELKVVEKQQLEHLKKISKGPRKIVFSMGESKVTVKTFRAFGAEYAATEKEYANHGFKFSRQYGSGSRDLLGYECGKYMNMLI